MVFIAAFTTIADTNGVLIELAFLSTSPQHKPVFLSVSNEVAAGVALAVASCVDVNRPSGGEADEGVTRVALGHSLMFITDHVALATLRGSVSTGIKR